MKGLIEIIFFLFFVTTSVVRAEVVRLGISEFAPNSLNIPIIEVTIKTLEDALGKDKLFVQTLSVAKLQKAVETEQIDVMLSSAGFFRKMAIQGTGVRDLATVASDRHPNPNFSDGSVFFTLKNRSDISSFKDLKHKSVAANHDLGFSGWQTALGEIFRHGEDPYHFFKEISFQGHEMGLVVDAVNQGKVDVGIVRNCFLEDNHLLETGLYKVINPRNTDRSEKCIASTDLYPNWTLSTLPSTSPEISRKITSALLAMPSTVHDLHWSIATDFTPIDKLFLDLKIGPYEYLKEFNLWRFVKEYKTFFSIGIIAIIALILHSLTVGVLVRKRTEALEKSIQREIELIRESHTISERLNELQRAGVVGQMSSIIAHELRQTLGSIGTFCYGLLRRIDNGNISMDLIRERLEQIESQSQKASAIVEEVRSYAKGQSKREAINLQTLVPNSIENLKKSNRYSGAKIALNIQSEIWIYANPLEIELVIINLVRNAFDALKELPDGLIQIEVRKERDRAILEVSDNGLILDDSSWDLINTSSMRTTKTE